MKSISSRSCAMSFGGCSTSEARRSRRCLFIQGLQKDLGFLTPYHRFVTHLQAVERPHLPADRAASRPSGRGRTETQRRARADARGARRPGTAAERRRAPGRARDIVACRSRNDGQRAVLGVRARARDAEGPRAAAAGARECGRRWPAVARAPVASRVPRGDDHRSAATASDFADGRPKAAGTLRARRVTSFRAASSSRRASTSRIAVRTFTRTRTSSGPSASSACGPIRMPGCPSAAGSGAASAWRSPCTR